MESESLSFLEKLRYCHRFWRYRRRSEPDTIIFIKEEFLPGGLALDIGANKGIVTYFLSRQAGPKGKVVAFEPQSEMNQQISRVAKTFGMSNIEIHTIGLSDKNGTATLFRGEAGTTANLVAGADWQNEKVEIETVTLDSFFETHQLDRLDFIKCDVDGFEAEVLNGAVGVLKKYSPKVLIEIDESDLAKITAIFEDFGYDGGVFWHGGKRYPASDTEKVSYRHPTAKWRNFLFCKNQ
tara:strand:+ start:303 stop:1016 length:714 start_codon:yes stop_codon:yes gene_type:complete